MYVTLQKREDGKKERTGVKKKGEKEGNQRRWERGDSLYSPSWRTPLITNIKCVRLRMFIIGPRDQKQLSLLSQTRPVNQTRPQPANQARPRPAVTSIYLDSLSGSSPFLPLSNTSVLSPDEISSCKKGHEVVARIKLHCNLILY